MRKRFQAALQTLLRKSAAGRAFLVVCAALAFGGTLTAAYPVVAIVVPATLLQPRRWADVAVVAALGSAVGATLLMATFHEAGWEQIYERFPDLATHADWDRVMSWASTYGVAALFLVALSPMPQTPALIFFGIAQQDYASVFLAMLAGKLLKYGLFCRLAARFPERYRDGIGGLLRRRG